jgi:hypothetical protein
MLVDSLNQEQSPRAKKFFPKGERKFWEKQFLRVKSVCEKWEFLLQIFWVKCIYNVWNLCVKTREAIKLWIELWLDSPKENTSEWLKYI